VHSHVQPPPQTIVIQPAQPTVVYVPTYNPTVVYGAPVASLGSPQRWLLLVGLTFVAGALGGSLYKH
jgi:hypothetical protein